MRGVLTFESQSVLEAHSEKCCGKRNKRKIKKERKKSFWEQPSENKKRKVYNLIKEWKGKAWYELCLNIRKLSSDSDTKLKKRKTFQLSETSWKFKFHFPFNFASTLWIKITAVCWIYTPRPQTESKSGEFKAIEIKFEGLPFIPKASSFELQGKREKPVEIRSLRLRALSTVQGKRREKII